jgi:hypothetical protein
MITAFMHNKDRSNAQLIHLHLDGYRPGRKARSDAMSICGTSSCRTEWISPLNGERYIYGELVPFSSALSTVAESGWLRWCPLCIGRAAQQLGLIPDVARLIVERELQP